jgi:hypothetical protein
MMTMMTMMMTADQTLTRRERKEINKKLSKVDFLSLVPHLFATYQEHEVTMRGCRVSG